MDFISLSLVFVWLYFFIRSNYLFIHEKYQYFHHTYSNLSQSQSGQSFNFALFLVAVAQTGFFINIWQIFHPNLLSWSGFGLICLIFTCIAGVVISLFPEHKYYYLHSGFGSLGFIASIPGWFLFGYYLFINFSPLGSILIAWGLLIMPIIIYLIYKFGNNAAFELILFIGAFITNLVIVYLL